MVEDIVDSCSRRWGLTEKLVRDPLHAEKEEDHAADVETAGALLFLFWVSSPISGIHYVGYFNFIVIRGEFERFSMEAFEYNKYGIIGCGQYAYTFWAALRIC